MNGSPPPPGPEQPYRPELPYPPDQPYPAWVPPDAVPPAAPRRSMGGFFTAYFTAGLALLLVGFIIVVILVLRPQSGHHATGTALPATSATDSAAGPTTEATTAPTPDSNGATLGPQQLTMGKTLRVTGENGEKFEVTVIAGKYRRTACDQYSVKPKNGGYLPTTVRVKVLEGVPEVSEFAFRFEKPDGEWLDSVGGSGCETTGSSGLFRRLTAGRTYTTMVVFDVPKQPLKGNIVFVWPLEDVIGSWKVN